MREQSDIRLIDKKHDLSDTMFLVETSQKRHRQIGAVPTKHDIKNQLCIEVYCSIHQDHSPLILTAVSSTATRDGCVVGGSGTLSASR